MDDLTPRGGEKIKAEMSSEKLSLPFVILEFPLFCQNLCSSNSVLQKYLPTGRENSYSSVKTQL
jgi:hypothetical protein